MMKKIKLLTLILIISLLMSIMLIPVSAWGETITVGSDFSYIEYNGENYVRVSLDDIYAVHAGDWIDYIIFDGGNDEVGYAEAYGDENAVELWVNYKKGGYARYYYINESLISRFNELVINGGEKFRIEFYSTTVTMTKAQLFGKELRVSGYELDPYSYTGDILFYAFDESISILSGYMLNDQNGNFYYVDYIKSSDGSDADLHEQKDVKLWQITDTELLEELSNASNDFGYPDDDIYHEDEDDDDDIGIGVGIVLRVILLGIVPLAGAIVTFCISFKCNKQYKFRLRIISALCLLAVIITAITVIICLAIAV